MTPRPGNVEVDAPSGDSYKYQWQALSGWFLGPRGENHDVFLDTFKALLEKHVELRNSYFPSDPAYITDAVRKSDAFESEVQQMKDVLLQSCVEMGGNVPFFSPRYQAHMCWDNTLPAILGYMSAMLFNQNNVDSAASPVTTLYEQTVGKQLCKMLGYNIDSSKNPIVGWGHVTCGGSVANIEALWASRNLKFVSMSVKNALENHDALDILTADQKQKGLNTKVTVFDEKSQKLTGVALKNCSRWQLLNMDVDEICSLADTVVKNMEIKDNRIESQFKTLIEKESVVNLGLFDFMKKNGLDKSPRYTCPANNHYSWPKGGTILGLGSDALIPIGLDKDFRQDTDDLKEKLKYCLDNEIPVLSVTAVIGSTEESAVDPIKEMYAIREEFKKKGLNFALLADAAWGGYFKTMVLGATGSEGTANRFAGYVPFCPLTDYVEKQYKHIQLVDTITIDPHKSGFCPYPGGALCYRNGKMRYNIAIYHPEVFHGEDDPTMGVYGIEGSKPAAAPAGILMSHNVIGLDNNGYGRILGQCTTTTKLFYCLWLIVAKDDDPFVCIPLQNIPKGYTMESAKKLIKETMAYKSMSEVYRNEEAFAFLKECGPDTMINTFGVNLKGNTDIELTNKLQIALSDAMNIYVGSSAKRVPLILMQSGFDAKKHGDGLALFKENLGLPKEQEKDLNVMVNTCMNPWQSNESIFLIGDLFRLIVLNSIGRLQDEGIKHKFVVVSDIDGDDNTVFLEYVSDMSVKEHQYQAAVKVRVGNNDKKAFKKLIKKSDSAVIVETVNKHNLYDLLHTPDKEFEVAGVNEEKITLKLVDVPRYQRLDRSSTVVYPKHQTYFIYGDVKRTIMSHVISKLPDFQHIVTLNCKPHSLTSGLQDLGVMANIVGVNGKPLSFEGKIISPLQREDYDINFKGELFSTISTSISINETVYFNPVAE